jgi:hypothetical protein
VLGWFWFSAAHLDFVQNTETSEQLHERMVC